MSRRKAIAFEKILVLRREEELLAHKSLVVIGPVSNLGDEVGKTTLPADTGTFPDVKIRPAQKHVVVALGHALEVGYANVCLFHHPGDELHGLRRCALPANGL